MLSSSPYQLGLPATDSADRAFATFLKMRNNLENPQDLEGLDAVNHSLAHISSHVITNEKLLKAAKVLAETCAANAIRLFKNKQSIGEATNAELDRLRSTVRRIVFNYNAI